MGYDFPQVSLAEVETALARREQEYAEKVYAQTGLVLTPWQICWLEERGIIA